MKKCSFLRRHKSHRCSSQPYIFTASMMFNSKFAHNNSIDLYIRLLLRAWQINKYTPRAQVSIQIASYAHRDIPPAPSDFRLTTRPAPRPRAQRTQRRLRWRRCSLCASCRARRYGEGSRSSLPSTRMRCQGPPHELRRCDFEGRMNLLVHAYPMRPENILPEL